MPAFELDPRLARDALPLGALNLCVLLLMKDARFPWLILVPQRNNVSELHDLGAVERAMLIEETARAAIALKTATGADKINVGALGNIVRQLHVHVVARFEGDAAWPGPVWGSGSPADYADGAAEALIAGIRNALGN